MDVTQAIRTMNAVRQFTDQPVSREDVDAILRAGRRAQSSKNTSAIAAMWERERAKEVLGIPSDLTFRLAISFGYPAAPAALPAGVSRGRKPLAEIVHWETW